MPVAVALSGGGAQGDFQVGALQYLYHQEGIRPDIICGTSVGAVNGVALAQGGAPDPWSQGLAALQQLESIWLKLEKNEDMYEWEPWAMTLEPRVRDLLRGGLGDFVGLQGNYVNAGSFLIPFKFILDFDKARIDVGNVLAAIDRALGAKSLFNLSPIERKLNQFLDINKVAHSGIKLRLAMVGLESGELRFVTEGGEFVGSPEPAVSLIQAVLASAAIPSIFRAIKLNSQWYVDGGVRETLPIQCALETGADRVYAITGTTGGVHRYEPEHPGDPPWFEHRNFFEIALRAVMEIMTDETLRNETNPPRGWGQEVWIIQPSYPVHDSFTIDPGLIRISMAYGFMRAGDVFALHQAEHRPPARPDVRTPDAILRPPDVSLRREPDRPGLASPQPVLRHLVPTGLRPEPLQYDPTLGQSSDEIISLRKRIWDSECEVSFLLKIGSITTEGDWTRTRDTVLSLRQMKRELKGLVHGRRQLGGAIPPFSEDWWGKWERHSWQDPPWMPTPWDRFQDPNFPAHVIQAEAPP